MKLSRFQKTAISAVFWLGLWYLVSLKVGQNLILPGPLAVLKELIRLCGTPQFWISAAVTLLRIFGGFFFGLVFGAVFAVLTFKSEILDAILTPMLRTMRAVPVASFIILALLWINRQLVPGFVSSLIVMPVVWQALKTAISETDGELLEMARAYKFGKMRTLKYVYLPSVMPAFRACAFTALGLSWKSGVAAEVLCLPKTAIGTQLYYSKIYLETPSLFAWTAVVVALSFLLEYALRGLFRERRDNL